MKLYSEGAGYKLYQGSMLDMLEVIEPESIDAIITDPPYELNFMGKGWDNSGIAFQKETWEKCYEVLKEGGYLLAFGGSRTFHRIACAIEDAGFEIRDTIMWLYGSGFPKSMAVDRAIEGKLTLGSANKQEFKKLNGEKTTNKGLGFTKMQYENGIRPKDYSTDEHERLVSFEPTTDLAKQWQGWGTALKPSYEPIIVARKRFNGSLVDNIIKNGVGAINIDECRVGNEERTQFSGRSSEQTTVFNSFNQENAHYETVVGRFPANTILTYDETDIDEVCGGFPDTSGGKRHNTAIRKSEKNSGYGFDVNTRNEIDDSGSASRYFYCAKASKKDRDEGLDQFENVSGSEITGRKEGSKGLVMEGGKQNPYAGKASPCNKNTHPTVKPVELMQYLVRLVCPKGATILDCFNGSGSTGKAVMYESIENDKNYKYIGIELTEEYLPIAEARIKHAMEDERQGKLF